TDYAIAMTLVVVVTLSITTSCHYHYSAHGVLAVKSTSPKKPFICSRCVRRDKQNTEKAVYLFAVSSPRQANRRKCRLSVRGEFAATSKSPEKPFICSRWVCRDKQSTEKAVYLFAVSSPRQANRQKCRLSIRGASPRDHSTVKVAFIYSQRFPCNRSTTKKLGFSQVLLYILRIT